MTLHELNTADESLARGALLRCCGSRRWADQMLTGRPYDLVALLGAASSVWWSLDSSDWLEAFSAHPAIGERLKAPTWSSAEQRGVESADPTTLEHLASVNQAYQQRFGWIYIVNATGKSAREMLALAETRLANEPAHELRIAAAEQAKITSLRLQKLLIE